MAYGLETVFAPSPVEHADLMSAADRVARLVPKGRLAGVGLGVIAVSLVLATLTAAAPGPSSLVTFRYLCFLALPALLLDDESARSLMRDTWARMAEFLSWVRHPDGQIPLLNDGGFNGVCSPNEMLARGETFLSQSVDPSSRRGGKLFPEV